MDGVFIITGYQQVGAEASPGLHTRFQLCHQYITNSFISVGNGHCQVIDHPAPPIETAHHGTNNLPVFLSHQEKVGIALNFFNDFILSVRAVEVDARSGIFPKLYHLGIIGWEVKLAEKEGGP